MTLTTGTITGKLPEIQENSSLAGFAQRYGLFKDEFGPSSDPPLTLILSPRWGERELEEEILASLIRLITRPETSGMLEAVAKPVS
jgi:hypothetical protein